MESPHKDNQTRCVCVCVCVLCTLTYAPSDFNKQWSSVHLFVTEVSCPQQDFYNLYLPLPATFCHPSNWSIFSFCDRTLPSEHTLPQNNPPYSHKPTMDQYSYTTLPHITERERDSYSKPNQ